MSKSELKVVGIDAKGYGKIYKAVMRDRCISLTAKALYAYFCSYAGSGTTAFPGQDRISHDLQITKNTLTKHLNIIVDAGYIARQRTAFGNVYEVLTVIPNRHGEDAEAKTMGYGTIPKLAMLDTRLPVGAKGVYAYLCSYAGSGHIAYPRRNTILAELAMGEGKYYRLFSILVECGYVTPTQQKTKDGRFSISHYRLNDTLGEYHGNSTFFKTTSKTKRKTALKGDSQKQRYGDETTDSQKQRHGETEVLNETLTANSQKQGYGDEDSFQQGFQQKMSKQKNGEKAISQKQMSQKTVPRFLVRPSNSNITHNKQVSIPKEIDIINNNRTHTHTHAREKAMQSPPVLTSSEIKELVNHNSLMHQFNSWSEGKAILGHFSVTDGQSKYLMSCETISRELAYQFELFFHRTASQIEVAGKYFNREILAQALKTNFPTEEKLFDYVCAIADKPPFVRNLRKYLRSAVLHFALQASGATQERIDENVYGTDETVCVSENERPA